MFRCIGFSFVVCDYNEKHINIYPKTLFSCENQPEKNQSEVLIIYFNVLTVLLAYITDGFHVFKNCMLYFFNILIHIFSNWLEAVNVLHIIVFTPFSVR